MTRNDARRMWLTAAAIFGIALAVRLLWMTVPINIDEAVWIRRGPAFYAALLTHDPAATYLKHHPGVTNMWIIGAGLSVRYWLRDLLPPDALISQSDTLLEYLRAVVSAPVTPLSAYVAARWASAIVTAASLAALYLLSRRVFGALVAVTVAVILLSEPFFVAYQRSITTDANQTNFLWIAYLAFLVYAGMVAKRLPAGRATFWAALSGVMFGLAVISKVTIMLTLPAFAVVALAVLWRGRGGRGWARLMGDALLWAGAALLAALVLWPALRADPLGTLTIWYDGLSSEVAGHDQFLLGQYTRAPGMLYYPVVLLARLSPLLLLGALLGLAALLAPRLRSYYAHRGATGAALLLTVVILLGISLFDSKHDRYIVPMLPGLAILAAGGIWASVRAWQARRGHEAVAPQQALPAVLALIFVAQMVVLLPHVPYYLSYFSPLVGGPGGAQKIVMVGNGELLDRAADWLEQNVPADARVGQRDYSASMAPYYAGRVEEIVMDAATGAWTLPEMEYVAVYSNQLQRRFPANLVDYFAPQRPLHTVQWRGADYVQIYQGPRVRPEQRAALPNPAAFDFGSYARLVGHDLETPEVDAGETAVLTLFWESVAPFPADDFSVYLGVRNADGDLVARTDTTPVGRFAPVNRWREGEILRDANLIRIPPGTPPGVYALEVGFFSPSLGQALEIRDSSGAQGNRVPVAQIRVAKPESPIADSTELGIAHLLPEPIAVANNGPALLGYDWEGAATVNAGAAIPVTLLWRAGEDAPKEMAIVTRLSGSQGSWQRPTGRAPGGPYPLTTWSPGELVRDTWPALLPAGAPSGRYRLELVAIAPGMERVLLDMGEVEVTGRARQFEAPAPAFVQDAAFGDLAMLTGYDTGAAACGEDLCISPAEPLELTLWWRAAAGTDRAITRFLHVLDAEGRLVAQRDASPGQIAATDWLPGEYVRDVVRFEPGEVPAGRYRLAVGLYDAATGQRLTLPDGASSAVLNRTFESQ